MVDAGCPGEMSSANHQSLHARLDDDQRPSSPNSIVKNSQRTSASTEASSSLEPISTMKKKMWSSMYMLEEIPDDSILLTLAHITNAFASGAIVSLQ